MASSLRLPATAEARPFDAQVGGWIPLKRKRLTFPDASKAPLTTAAELLQAYKRGQRDFHFIRLDGARLGGHNLTGASFYCASLRNVDLSAANLEHIQLKGADLTGASLERARINASDLIGTNFTEANLSKADFTGASLSRAECINADLRSAYLGSASLPEINLQGANLTGITLGHTHLDDADVRPFCDALQLKHSAPSSVDARTVMRSFAHPKLKEFVVACGVPPLFADYMIECARALGEAVLKNLMQSTFISYGAPDEAFARRLYESLKEHGIVVFFFPENARVGERINNEVFRQLQKHDRVLLVCSRKSLNRPGVVNEIQETLDREARDGGATYLLPIMLDDYVLTDWKKTQPILSERLSRRVIADFRKTRRSKAAFSTALNRVIDSLKIRRPSTESTGA